MGFVFGTATYGTPDAHLSLAVGAPFVFAENADAFTRPFITTLSGNLRVSQRLALITENWLVPTLNQQNAVVDFLMFNSLALRIFGERWAVDVGAIRVPYWATPIPWLDFTYNFG